jgi:hypothetical protein
MRYGLYFWGTHHIFKKYSECKKIRIMMGCNSRVPCRNLFRKLEILPLATQYILSFMLFVVNNKNLFILNSEKHKISTKHIKNFYQPISNFTVYQSGLRGLEVTFPPHDPSSNPAEVVEFLTMEKFREQVLREEL